MANIREAVLIARPQRVVIITSNVRTALCACLRYYVNITNTKLDVLHVRLLYVVSTIGIRGIAVCALHLYYAVMIEQREHALSAILRWYVRIRY